MNMIDNLDYSDLDEVINLLKGYYPLLDGSMDSTEPLPTSPYRVVRFYLYAHPECADVFHQAMLVLVKGSVADVYMCFQYFNVCLYWEQKGRASFQIKRNLFCRLLKESIRHYYQELCGTITFWDGTQNKNPMYWIKTRNENYKKDYGFSLLD